MPLNLLRPLLVDGVQGLGDNLYQRAAVAAVAATGRRLFVRTSWPQFYADLPGVAVVRPVTRLRTQNKNLRAFGHGGWSNPPARAERVGTLYGDAELRRGTILQHFSRAFGLGDHHPLRMSIPEAFEPPPLRVPADRPLCVVRPVVTRQEWRNEARNPDPAALAALLRHIRRTHYVVSVADLVPGQEWLEGPAPEADMTLHRGLPVEQLLGLVEAADLVVGGVGWIVPAALATGTPAFILLGGQGAHNAPEVILDPRLDSRHVGFGWPAEFCRCNQKLHACRKGLPDAVRQFENWRSLLATSGRDVDAPGQSSVAA